MHNKQIPTFMARRNGGMNQQHQAMVAIDASRKLRGDTITPCDESCFHLSHDGICVRHFDDVSSENRVMILTHNTM